MKGSEKMTVFVVDSSSGDRWRISGFLEGNGFTVKSFLTGTVMMSQLTDHPALIVLNHDVGEETTGLQFLRRIRAVSSSTPVLFMCNTDDTATAVSALRQGAFYYIEKDALLMENMVTALADLDLEGKRKFRRFLQSFRRSIYSFYNVL